MTTILGIDEAGRGAVIGPLVICGALITEKNIKKLKELEVKDSKELSPKRRMELSMPIKNELDAFEIIRIDAQEIDLSRNTGTNLNELEAKNMAQLINNLKPDKAYIDAVDAKITTFKKRLNNYLRVDTKIIAEHKADKIYPIVSSASILAKVERDTEIEELKKIYGEIGSGYPSDEITKRFLRDWLKEHNKLPRVVRKTWSTVSSTLVKGKQKTLEDFLKNETNT